jgi:hypothetical protein
MDKQRAIAILLNKLEEWDTKSKKDGYEYEENFVDVMQGLNHELFQLSLGELPKDRNKKKSTNAIRHGYQLKKTSDLS